MNAPPGEPFDSEPSVDSGDRTTDLAPPGSATAATVVGRYHLLQKIGEGGMGEVWLAEQKEPVRRRVALKLVKAGMNTREVIGRFESERQALALMEHPAIAKVLDAGSTPDGAPYFVMEYVAGVPITEYCDNHRLSIKDRLVLFMHVCEGVRHAHQKAVIHRDLKPSNILVAEVDGHPAPKIIDFGVAKALSQKLTAQTMFTRVGSLVGTPEYMSPEQALSSGEDVDTRTDVYSLGIVFYELLAGAPPIELRKVALDEYLRRLREEDPPKPSTKIRTRDAATSTELARRRQTEPAALMKQIGGDLDSIALKALEKDRARRYGSASDFAADIARYLNHEAVSAVPPSAAYRARKFAGRHRWGLVMACAFVAVLAAAAAITIRQSIRANRQAMRADREAAVAEAVSHFLRKDVLAQASSSAQSGPSTKPDPDLKVRTALDRAAERITGKFNGQPELEASIRDTIGETYLDLGLYPEARKQLEQAVDLYRRASGAEHPDTLRAMCDLGGIALLQGRYPEAEALLSQALQTQRRVLGAQHPDTLDSAANLAALYINEGKYPQAEALENEVVEANKRVRGLEDSYTLRSMSNLGILYYREGKYQQAEALDSQTLEIERRVLGSEHGLVVSTMNNLAIIYFDEGKYAQSEALQSQVLEIKRRVLGPEHPNTLASMNNLALVYQSEGHYAQAEALQRQTAEIRRRVLGPDHPETLESMVNLAAVYDDLGEYAQAEGLLSDVLETQRRLLGPEHPNTLNSIDTLAGIYGDQGKYQKAEALFTQVVEMRRRVLGPEHPDTLMSMSNLAVVCHSEGKYGQAEALFSQIVETAGRVLGPENRKTLSYLSGFAFVYQRQGKYALAETYATRALTGKRHALGLEDTDTMVSEADLALAYVSQQKFADAELLARDALEHEKKIQPDNWQRYRAESLLGASLAGQKKYDKAEPLLLEGYQGVFARKEQIGAPDRYHLDRAHDWLVQMYVDWGKPDQAAKWNKK
jgi:eukaryotic-like serine/threonine-protein kinase